MTTRDTDMPLDQLRLFVFLFRLSHYVTRQRPLPSTAFINYLLLGQGRVVPPGQLVYHSVILSVSEQHYCQSNQLISLKLGVM